MKHKDTKLNPEMRKTTYLGETKQVKVAKKSENKENINDKVTIGEQMVSRIKEAS